MGLRVHTNTASLNTQLHMRGYGNSINRAMDRIASGTKITKSSDDAAGLAISEKLRSNIRGLKQAERNAQDGISMTQIAEGSLSQIGNILVRLRELSLQAANDTFSDNDRLLLSHEYTHLLSEIDRIACSTEFNGTKLLMGVGDKIDLQINTRNSDETDRVSFDPIYADSRTHALGLDWISVVDKEGAQNSLEKIDNAINNVSNLRASFGSIQSRLASTTENILTNVENLSAANSRIKDADIAEESSELAKKNMMLQTGTSILAQANQLPGQALSLLSRG